MNNSINITATKECKEEAERYLAQIGNRYMLDEDFDRAVYEAFMNGASYGYYTAYADINF